MPIKKIQLGFTLIELMIVVAIIGILSSIAIPAYQNYFSRTRFSEVILATSSPKIAIEICAQTYITTNFKTDCIDGKNGINNVTNPSDHVGSVNISGGSNNNKVLITATSRDMTPNANYILEATLANGQVSWNLLTSSTCQQQGWC